MIIENDVSNPWAFVLEYCIRHPDEIVDPATIPLSLTADQVALLNSRNAYITRRTNAKIDAVNIPNWATWGQTEWATWYNANISPTQINTVTTLTQAKPILVAMSTAINNLAKMEIALRNIAIDIPNANEIKTP